jgi:hypothetical protein
MQAPVKINNLLALYKQKFYFLYETPNTEITLPDRLCAVSLWGQAVKFGCGKAALR